MSNKKLFDSTLLTPSISKIKSDIDDINEALTTISNIDIISCWSKFTDQNSESTSQNLKTKYEFIINKIPTIKESLNSYIDFLTKSQTNYIEISDEIISDLNTIINKTE